MSAVDDAKRVAVILEHGSLVWDGYASTINDTDDTALRCGGKIRGEVHWSVNDSTPPDHDDCFTFSVLRGVDRVYSDRRFTSETDARRACEEAVVEYLFKGKMK